jgi:hypothetical protein
MTYICSIAYFLDRVDGVVLYTYTKDILLEVCTS